MKKWLVMGTVLVLLAIIGGILTAKFYFEDKPSQTIAPKKSYTNNLGVRTTFPTSINVVRLTDADKKERIDMRLSGSNPEILITGRSDTGLKVITSVTKTPMIDALLSSLKKSYPKRFPEFKLEDTNKLTVSDQNAANVTFTYKSPSDETVKQRLLIISLDENTAYYLSAQTLEKDFATANSKYFDEIFSSISIE
jgi:hypothetical protein